MEYATISDAWGDDTFCKKDNNKRKSVYNKVYDNIIDSYIDDFDKSKSMKINKHVTKCNDEVKPFSAESPFMSYDDYFSNTNLFESKEPKKEIVENKIVQEEEVYSIQTIQEEEGYSNNDDSEEESRNNTEQHKSYYNSYNAYENNKKYQYIDLILYIISGVFLIFMFEQILNIAKVIKS